MRLFIVFSLSFLLCGCMGTADYRGAPSLAPAESAKPVDPESFRVDSKNFPRYRLTHAFEPPRWTSEYDQSFTSRHPMVEILPSDEWIVRHQIGDLLLISCAAYDQRQWKLLKAAEPGAGAKDYLYTIFIDREGRVAGGWMLLHNPERVIFSADRKTFLTPIPWGNKGWEGVQFEQIK